MQELIEALREHVSDEPPLQLTSADVLAAGRRSRRRRRLATVLGVVSAAMVVGLVFSVPGPVAVDQPERPPVASQPPSEARCAQLAGPPPEYLSRGEAAERVSCYLSERIGEYFPIQMTLIHNGARPGTEPLVAGTDPIGGEDGVAATAVVRDPAGDGTLLLAVSRATSPGEADRVKPCDLPMAKATCRTGPHGEHIEIYETDGQGIQGWTVYVYSAGTRIIATALNYREGDPGDPTRYEPPLTVGQLIDLATAPALKLYR